MLAHRTVHKVHLRRDLFSPDNNVVLTSYPVGNAPLLVAAANAEGVPAALTVAASAASAAEDGGCEAMDPELFNYIILQKSKEE